jgi:hypothetical protein
MEIKNEGLCRFCLKRFSGRGISRHLASCRAKKQSDEADASRATRLTPIYHIRVWGYSPFWLHLEVKATATLTELDEFLRAIWLECCGHLSEFRINGVSYLVPVAMDGWWDPEARTMDTQLQAVLDVNSSFEYEYDFGSTTYLEGKVLARREGVLRDKIRILARNGLPELQCVACQAKAAFICVECWGLYCGECLVEHECGEEMSLPVVNSPRMGVCGFAGDYDFDDFEARVDA